MNIDQGLSTENYPLEYHPGGALSPQAWCYVTRQADYELYQNLKKREYCFVFNGRQTGKTSLLLKTSDKLNKEDISCIYISLQAIGVGSVDQWYESIISNIVKGANLDIDLLDWLQQNNFLTPVARFSKFIDEILLQEKLKKAIVIFIDEIDFLLSLDFETDDFFTTLRDFYMNRAKDSRYERLTFCLLGVITVSQLIRDKKRTPLNIGKEIEIKLFTLEEASLLAQGLIGSVDNPKKTLEIILNMTEGQPFLTQKICDLVLEKRYNNVQDIIQNNIIHNWEEQDHPQHFRTIRDQIIYHPDNANLLRLYKNLLFREEIPFDDSRNQMELRLSGLVRRKGNYIQVLNRIYTKIFNQEWVTEELNKLCPFSESLSAWVDSNGLDESRLLRGKALQEATLWLENNPSDTLAFSFIKSSQDFENNAKLRKRVNNLQLIIACIGLLIVSYIGIQRDIKFSKILNSQVVLGLEQDLAVIPAGWMWNNSGKRTELENARVDPKEFMNMEDSEHCYTGESCRKITYKPIKKYPLESEWSSILWWHFSCGSTGTDEAWEKVRNGTCSINLLEQGQFNTITRLTWWARGETGNEVITFRIGGEDVFPRPGHSNKVTLTTEWEKYEIDLRDSQVDLTAMTALFMWIAEKYDNPRGAVFYLDDIQFEGY